MEKDKKLYMIGNAHIDVVSVSYTHLGSRMQIIAGIDIGGTKSAVSFARYADGGIEILDKVKRPMTVSYTHLDVYKRQP